jgi:hypothetical protein
VGVRELVPAAQEWRLHAPSRFTLACLGVCALILVVAALDLAHTESRLPDVSTADCGPEHSSCVNAQLSERVARDRAAEPLQDQFNSRAWIYTFATLATVAVATAFSLRANPRREWPRIFTNLGVIGVWLAIAVVITLLATDGEPVTIPAAQALTLPVVLVVAAVTGTLLGRSEGWAEQGQGNGVRDRVIHLGRIAIHVGTAGQAKRSRMEKLARWTIYAALGLSALTLLLALILTTVGQPDCGGGEGPAGWTDAIDSVVAVSAIGGIAAGVAGLVMRRWIVALISLIVCPISLLVVLASTCAFY